MNPGYEDRSNLPDNLKNLFRPCAMVVPDRKLIAQVMLYSQGIVTAEQLSGKVVDLFLLCKEKMSNQRHYDFGLPAFLKTLLVTAGAMARG
jgi:dynein heavy chain 1, cytosolic